MGYPPDTSADGDNDDQVQELHPAPTHGAWRPDVHIAGSFA
jgi:hypothetical protein